MEALKLNKFLESFERLEADEKEYAIEVINKKMSDENRKKIVNRVKEVKRNIKNGKVNKGSVEALYKDLEND